MTSTTIDTQELPSLNAFLSSVSPGITNLQSNIHFAHEFNNPNVPKSFIWPLNVVSNNVNKLAKLSDTYLNVARPPLNPGPGIFESNTYVSLPYHITSLFDKVIDVKVKTNSLDGGMQIGANVGAMMPDPYQLVRLNPGCLSEIVTLSNESRNPFDDSYLIDEQQSKNPFTKLTNNFNKLLKLTSSTIGNQDSESSENFHDFHDLLPCFNPNGPKSIDSDSIDFSNAAGANGNNTHGSTSSNGTGSTGNGSNNPNSTHFNNLLNFDDSYFNTITSINTAKLLVSTHVNVVNVFAIDSELNLSNGYNYTTNKPYTSLLDNTMSENELKKNKKYTKSIEVPLLRFDLKNHLIITEMKVFKLHNKVPILLLGLNSGELIIINLFKLTHKIVSLNANNGTGVVKANGNGLAITSSSSIKLSPTITNTPVTSMDVLAHPLYEFLIVVGLANGEVLFVNPFGSAEDNSVPKKAVDEDQFVTYFKKFDLSPFNHQRDNSVVVGHIKLSHKPITCISSTVSLMYPSNINLNPMLVAIGSDDGLVRLFSLTSTYNCDYGSNTNRKSLISDLVSNYFHYGIRDVKFSSDFKFLSVAGDGDLIEMFKLSYYNVNGLLNKNNNAGGSGRRSRSGTVNSTASASQANPTMNLFLSPTATSHSTSLDTSNNDVDMSLYPPAVKDIELVCRLKSHSNTTTKIDFITSDQVFSDSLEDSKQNSSLYRLVSCGDDGKVIFWEFDYKVLPKIRKLAKRKPKETKETKESKDTNTSKRPHSSSLNKRPANAMNLPIPGANSTGNMTSILNSHSGSGTNLNSNLTSNNPSQSNLTEFLTDQFKGVTGLYISLYDIRYKKHYNNLIMSQRQINKPEDLKFNNNKYQSIIHPIVNDKLVPSIETPISTIDLSFWLKDGKISTTYVDAFNFWGFGKNGDIIRYKVE